MNKLQRHLKLLQLQQAEKRINQVQATVTYLENGAPRQQPVAAPTEEELLETIFMIPVDAFPDKKITIKQVHYRGQLLYWNDFFGTLAFCKSRMSFEEFKAACLNEPRKNRRYECEQRIQSQGN